MKIILVRHGETVENLNDIVQGHLHGTLSPLGIEQAKKVALRLKDEKIDYIFSSDLARASDTAKEIAKFHPRTPIEFTKELRERYFGTFEGKKAPENWKTIRGNLELSKKFSVETSEETVKRANSFMDKVHKKFQRGAILFVGHNGINKAMIIGISGKSWEETEKLERQGNTSVTIFEFDERNPTLKLNNCMEHLK